MVKKALGMKRVYNLLDKKNINRIFESFLGGFRVFDLIVEVENTGMVTVVSMAGFQKSMEVLFLMTFCG